MRCGYYRIYILLRGAGWKTITSGITAISDGRVKHSAEAVAVACHGGASAAPAIDENWSMDLVSDVIVRWPAIRALMFVNEIQLRKSLAIEVGHSGFESRCFV